MKKEITVAGIKLKNYNVMEDFIRITKNYQENIFTTIEEVDMKTILLAKEEEAVKEVLELADVTIFTESGILDAVGQATILRRAEIDRREFFFQFMKITERNGHTVYILGETETEVSNVRRYIEDEFPRVKIAASKALDENSGEEDAVINDINTAAPKIVLGVLSSPARQQFLKAYRSMLSSKIWYGADAGRIVGTKLTFHAGVMKFFRKLTLKRYLKEENGD